MIGFHLRWEIFLKPLVLLYEVADKIDSYLSLNLDGSLAVFGVVEPCLCEPAYSEPVWIDANCPGNIEALYVDIPVGQWINQSLAQYGLLIYFFFKPSPIVDRNI